MTAVPIRKAEERYDSLMRWRIRGLVGGVIALVYGLDRWLEGLY